MPQLQQVADKTREIAFARRPASVWRPLALVKSRAGYSNVAKKTPMNVDDTFIIAAPPSPFVGTLALQLIGEGN